jgi:hypothetical protein
MEQHGRLGNLLRSPYECVGRRSVLRLEHFAQGVDDKKPHWRSSLFRLSSQLRQQRTQHVGQGIEFGDGDGMDPRETDGRVRSECRMCVAKLG